MSDIKNSTFDEWACRKAKARLDSYIDDELLVETNLEMAGHLARCRACAREAAGRREVRARLRGAVRLATVPEGLDCRVRARLRQAGRERRIPWNVMAIATALVLCFGSWFTYEHAMLRIGAGDHVHCAVIGQGLLKTVGQDKLPAQYQPLLAVARAHAPSGMHLTVAHECASGARKFVHITFRGEHRLLSVILTRKGEWEHLPGGLHAAEVKGFQAAAFETDEYLVYTVSDLPKQDNLRILSEMSPAIRRALAREKA